MTTVPPDSEQTPNDTPSPHERELEAEPSQELNISIPVLMEMLAPVIAQAGFPEIKSGETVPQQAIAAWFTEVGNLLEEHQSLTVNLPVAITRLLPDGMITYANDAAAQLLGTAPTQLEGTTYAEVSTSFSNQVSAFGLQFSRVLDTGEQVVYEFTQGDRNYQAVLSPEIGETGEVISILCCTTDITTRVAAERLVATQSALLRAVIESSPTQIFIYSVSGTLLMMNQKGEEASREILGTALSPGMTLEEVMTYFDGHADEFTEFFTRAKDGEVIFHEAEYSFPGSSEITKWWQYQYYPVYVDGSVVGIALIVADIDARKKAEEGRRRNEAISSAMLNSAEHAIVMISPNGMPMIWNTAANTLVERLTGQGITRDRDYISTVAPESRERFRKNFEECLTGKVVHFEDKFMIRSEELSLIRTFYPVWSDGVLIGVAYSVRDVTEIRRKERELIMAETLARTAQETAATLARFAHDVRSPMTAILGYLDLLSLVPDLPKEALELLERALDSVKPLQMLSARMMELSRQNVHKPRLITMAEVLGQVAQVTGIQSFGIPVIMPDGDMNHSVYVDSVTLASAINNLVINGIHAVVTRLQQQHGFESAGDVYDAIILGQISNEGAYVRCTYEYEGDELVIVVEDSGTGISPEHLSNIYELYFTTKEEEEAFNGTGLGMPSVRRNVILHQGTVNIYTQVNVGDTIKAYTMGVFDTEPREVPLQEETRNTGTKITIRIPKDSK